ncbi:MAG: TVP38/TMEM64 family protein [Thermodesulfobacteriota bacterium]
MEIGQSQGKNNVWLRLLLLVAIVAGLSFAFYESGLIHFFMEKKRLVHFLRSAGPWDEVLFVALQAAQVVVAPIPGEVTGLAGGYLYGPLLGIVWSTIGLTIGSYLAFVLSRSLGRPVVERFVPKSTMDRFDYLLHHRGAFIVFLLFLIPGFPKDTLCWFLGLGHLTTAEFLLIGGTGRLFGTVLLTLGGNLIHHHQYKEFLVLVGVALVVILLAMAYRDKMERIFRFWHIKGVRKRQLKLRNQDPKS